MSRCRRCNRRLKTEPWATLGIGKICSSKENTQSGPSRNDSDRDDIVPYDGGDIFIERIDHKLNTLGGVRTNIQRTVYKHSPTGFNFGYGGSGPADTALNCLLMFTDKETAYDCYQDFKFKYLGQQGVKILIPKQEILNFIEESKIKKLCNQISN